MPCGLGAALEAVLNDGLVFFRCVCKLSSFPDVVGNGFFDVSVLAVSCGGGGDERMSMVGRGDDHGVDVFGFADLAVVLEFRDFDSILFKLRG